MIGVILFVLLQIADIVTTIAALKLPGLREANPVMLAAMARVGIVPALLLLKIAVTVVVVVAYSKLGWKVTVLPDLLYVYIVGNNLRLLAKAKQT